MKRYLHGLRQATASSSDEGLLDGLFLVRVERAQYRWHARKPYYALVFSVLAPNSLSGVRFNTRLDCNPKALWKLNWFLRDFGYDSELLGRDEIDDTLVIGLSGVAKLSRAVMNGTSQLNLDAFAPVSDWPRLSAENTQAAS
jgi:hypothetical protein